MSSPSFAALAGLGPSDLLALLGFLFAYLLVTAVLVHYRPFTAPTLADATRCPNCGAAHDPGYRYCAHCVGSVTGA